MKKTDSTYDSKTIDEVYELYKLEKKFKEVKKKYEDKKKKLSTSIKNYMYSNNWNSFEYRNSNNLISVKSVKQKRIIWNPEKLEAKLDKELCNEFITKEYKVNNIECLVKYLKSCGVNPKKFKSFISVEKKVDSKKLNELSEIGEISLDDINDCYSIKESESFLRIDIKEE